MVSSGFFGFALMISAVATQQPSSIVSNPSAIEFEVAAKDRSNIAGYRVEIFANGSDIPRGQPVRTIDVPRISSSDITPVRVELGTILDGLPDGSYIATLRVVGPGGVSARSAPTSPFEVTGLADRLPPRPPVLAGSSSPVQSVPPQRPAADGTDASGESRSKLGIVAAIAIAVATIAVLVVR